MSRLLTFISPKKNINIKEASKLLDIPLKLFDLNFGVVEIDPEANEFCVLINDRYKGEQGFKNVRIEPMNLEEE